MRRFVFFRKEDVSGKSGTGIVFEGIEFSSGKVVTEWREGTRNMGIYENIDSVKMIHGHQGRGKIVWLEDPGDALKLIEEVHQEVSTKPRHK